MIPNNIRSIVDKLKEKTQNGQTIWSQSSGANGFRLTMNKGSINVDKWDQDQNNDSVISLKIFNERGDVIEQLNISESESRPDYDYLDSFYTVVRRKYLKVDETLKGFLDELNDSKIIGKKEDTSNEPIDDLPF